MPVLAASACKDKPEAAPEAEAAEARPAPGELGNPPEGEPGHVPDGELGKPTPTPGPTLPKEYDTAGGVHVEVKSTGTGRAPKSGQRVFIHYTGTLENGAVFDSTHTRGAPLDIEFRRGKVIPGLIEGLDGLPAGSKVRLTIPPELGYGKRGAGDRIPPDSKLIFDLEIVRIAD
ncbi:FKBP-type peptidyl-prolyl cis-trans isomerase [Candidatus Poribacteria bacterium]|nr:FKBP-type peptidyl-prolyl cis-trans isomerase [Candidatus Poribacteria bacterium]